MVFRLIGTLHIDAAEAIAFARENNPKYLESRQQTAEARREAEKAKVEKNLSVSLDASIGLNQVADNFGDAYRHLLSQDMATVTLSIPLKDWGKRKNAYLAARSNVETAERTEQETARDTELDVALTVADFNERQTIVETARQALTIAEDAYAQTLQRFIKGQADAYSLSVAQSNTGIIRALNGKTLVPYKTITLTDDATEISAWNGGVADVTLTRTFPAGKKQTVCLPFDPSGLLNYGKVWAFTGIENDKAVMTQLTGSLAANTPYIFEATNEVTSIDFSKVTINIDNDPKTDNGALVFHGTYAQKTWEADAAMAANIYGFMLADNDGQQVGQFVKARRRTILRPFSCWLEKTTDGALSGTASTRGMTRGSDDEPEVIGIIWRSATGETTGIVDIEHGTWNMEHLGGVWYSLDGRRLQGKPTKKGIYINNGKKVVIR